MKTCQYSDIQQYINNVIPIKRQESSRVYIYIKDGKKYAYKEYRATSLFSQNHISQMADYLNELFTPIKPNDYRDFQVFSAVPLCLVYDQTVFKGFIMECIPDRCYFQRTLRSGETRKEEGVLDWFWNGKINDYSDQDKASFVKRLIRAIKILHQHDIVLGDAISSNNLLIAEYDGMLAPFFIDTDSFRNKKENPTAIYNSPNYYPPEGQTAISTKETDIYKLCLIILRFFSTDNIHRPSIVKGDLEANNSLNKIGSVFSDSFRKSVENGLSCNPKDRPTAYKMENDINNQFGKQQDIANAFHTDTQDKPTTLNGNSKPSLNETCPCGSGLKYKNCHGKLAGNTPTKLPISSSATSASTNKPKQTPSVSPSSKTANSGSTTSSNANKPKQSTADVQRIDNDSLNRFKRVRVSLVFILLTLALLLAILALSKCEVPSSPWNIIAALIPIVAWWAYCFVGGFGFDEEYNASKKYNKALWVVILAVLLMVLCNNVFKKIGKEIVLLDRAVTLAYNVYSLPIFALVTAGSVKYLTEKDRSGQHKAFYKCLSIILCSVLAMLLVIGTVKQIKEFNSLKVGDVVLFGCYEQDGDTSNGQEEISWTVMSVDDGKALLVSDVCLYAMPYNSDRTDNSWTNSDLRKWLNGEFYQSAFSSTEQGVIIEKEITTERRNDKEGDTYFKPYGEAEVTIDKVFVPDYFEYWKLTSDLNVSTVAKEIFTSHNTSYGSENYRSMFWTRSPFGEERNYASGYNSEQERSWGYIFWPNEYAMVRPAIYVDIDLYSDLPSEKQDQTAPASDRNNNTVGGGWGDSSGGRQTYTIKQINEGVLGDTITFNSIVDTNDSLSPEDKAAGVIIPLTDERNFVGARENSGNYGKDNLWNGNVIEAEEGKTYLVRLYVHNNSPHGYDAIAENVSVQFQITDLRHVLQNDISLEGFDSSNGYYGVGVNGFIDASNANPSSYWDGVKFVSDKPFELRYIPGTALLENNGIGATNGSGYKLNDDIVTDKKVLLGYDSLDGNIPGCYGYAAYVTIEVEPVFLAAKLQIVARLKGTAEWVEAVDAQIGDEVEYQIEYKNLLSSTVEDVMIRDVLPDNIEYIEGSTILFNSNHPEGVSIKNDTVTTTGINIGSYEANGNAYVRFLGRVIDKSLAHGSNQLVNWASVTIYIDNEAYVYKDDVSAMVDKRQ